MKYERVTFHGLRTVVAHARSKLSAAQRRNKIDFDRKGSIRQVINAGDFVSIDRPPRASTEAEMQDPGRLDGSPTDASCKLWSKFKGPYCVRLATDTVVHTARDSVTTSVSLDRVMN